MMFYKFKHQNASSSRSGLVTILMSKFSKSVNLMRKRTFYFEEAKQTLSQQNWKVNRSKKKNNE